MAGIHSTTRYTIMIIRFLKDVTVSEVGKEGRAFMTGEEVDASVIPEGNLTTLWRLKRIEEVTPKSATVAASVSQTPAKKG